MFKLVSWFSCLQLRSLQRELFKNANQVIELFCSVSSRTCQSPSIAPYTCPSLKPVRQGPAHPAASWLLFTQDPVGPRPPSSPSTFLPQGLCT